MAARIIDPREDNGDELDLSELNCPSCGCNSVEVLQYPQGTTPRRKGGAWSGSWFGSQGQARCNHCGVVFGVTMEEDEDE